MDKRMSAEEHNLRIETANWIGADGASVAFNKMATPHIVNILRGVIQASVSVHPRKTLKLLDELHRRRYYGLACLVRYLQLHQCLVSMPFYYFVDDIEHIIRLYKTAFVPTVPTRNSMLSIGPASFFVNSVTWCEDSFQYEVDAAKYMVPDKIVKTLGNSYESASAGLMVVYAGWRVTPELEAM